MTHILKIDSSARRADNPALKHNSISRQLGQRFIHQWMSLDSQSPVVERDVGQSPPGYISQDWIAAVFMPAANRTPEQAEMLEESDRLIAEVRQADLILITAPMYNYGMPAALKAWFDQVIRINETFSFDLSRGDYPLAPILSGKTLVLLSSCGEFGFEKEGPRESMNHLGTHIKTLSRYLGVENFYEIRSEYQEFGDSRHFQSLAAANQQIDALVSRLGQREQDHVCQPE